jgi:hypothetical protein
MQRRGGQVHRRGVGQVVRRVVPFLAVAAVALLFGAAPAAAEDTEYGGGSHGPPPVSAPPSSAPPSSAVESVTGADTSSGTSSLPFTGGDLLGVAAIGAGCAALGTLASRFSRRTRW